MYFHNESHVFYVGTPPTVTITLSGAKLIAFPLRLGRKLNTCFYHLYSTLTPVES